jgi:hypothetical protein
MPLRPPAGFISANFDPLKNPDAPTEVTASGGDTQASVSFSAPVNPGGSAISAYYAVSNPDRITVSGATSPITVTGLTNNTAYTFQVWALNSYGPGAFSAASGSVTPLGTRGLFGGGQTTVATNVIQYITISSVGNATDFGDLINNNYSTGMVSCSSTTRAIWRYGSTLSAAIVYTSIATTGDASAFGNLTVTRGVVSSCSNNTRGLFTGTTTGTNSNIIDYITIATIGNATDFGDTSFAYWNSYAACASPTRGIIASGGIRSGTTNSNVIEYVTINTTGDSINFGELTVARYGLAACSNATRGIFGGGFTGSGSNIIDYITIATTGNAIDFGDLSTVRSFLSACASLTRGVFGGGSISGTSTNIIEYVTIASTGNAIDFGDLLAATSSLAACSSGHGGLA